MNGFPLLFGSFLPRYEFECKLRGTHGVGLPMMFVLLIEYLPVDSTHGTYSMVNWTLSNGGSHLALC